MVEIMLNNFWRRKGLNHFVKLCNRCSAPTTIIWTEMSLLKGEFGGSGSDISPVQAPNSKFNSNLGSGRSPPISTFNNFYTLSFLGAQTLFGNLSILNFQV